MGTELRRGLGFVGLWGVLGEPVGGEDGGGGGGTQNSFNNYGNIGSVQQAGAYSSQTSTATITDDHREAMRGLIGAFDEVRPAFTLTDDDQAAVATAVEAVRVAADNPDTSPSVARELVGKVRSELMARSAGFIAGALASTALEVYQALGS